MMTSQPVKGRTGVGQFSLALIKTALTLTHTAKIEAQSRKVMLPEGPLNCEQHLIVHSSAIERMGMQE
jgi:hypothetical protein